MAWGSGSASPGQKVQLGELVVQSSQDVAQRERTHVAGREFDGERQAVQAPADLGHQVAVAAMEREFGEVAHGAVDEEPYGIGLHQGRHIVSGVGRRQGQLTDPEHGLSGHPQGLPAGGQDPQTGAAAQQGRRQPGARLGQMLAVVQNQHPGGVTDRPDQHVDAGPARSFAHPQRGGQGLRQQRAVLERGEFHEVDSCEALR